MKIRVTREDIKRGAHCDPDCCPVGRALSRAGITHLGVLGAEVVVEDGPEHAAFLPLPTEVKNWILSFDGFEPVRPITFYLRLPTRQQKGHGQRRTNRVGHQGRALVVR